MPPRRTRRVMVNFTEDEYQRMMEAVEARHYRISLSSFIKDVLDSYYASLASERSHPASEQPTQNAHQNAPNGPRSVCHLREV